MDNTLKKYVQGFNASYLITDHKPKLIEALLEFKINNDYFQGMKDGKLTLEKEKGKVLSKKKSRLQELKQNRPKNRNRDFER